MLKEWILAARPQTLPAAFSPVFVGAAIAFHDGLLRWDSTLIALICAFIIQIGTNFANDYYDFVKGADTQDRKGFRRATASGTISATAMKNAAVISMLIAFLVGLYLVWVGGWPILIIGLLSILFGILYTGGPYPLGYNGLGDIFVFIFFGIVAVMGTYYVNALKWSMESFVAGCAVGALSTNILVVNNLRDIETDRPAGKRTLGVIFGAEALKIEYLLMMLIAFVVVGLLLHLFQAPKWILLSYISAVPAVVLLERIWKEPLPERLNPRLKQTAGLLSLYSILLGIGFIL